MGIRELSPDRANPRNRSVNVKSPFDCPYSLPSDHPPSLSYPPDIPPYKKMAAVQQNSILCRFPAEILENIALEVVASEPLGPPKALIPLLCTCKSVHNVLAFNQSYDLFARVFQTKFDIGAVRRRFGPKSVRSTNLAMQLKKYCTNLQEIRRGDIHSPDIHDILRTSFLMATENDGKNARQLAWAGLDTFVDRFVRARLCEDVAQHNGWPAESSVNALALWLMWFTTTQGQFLKKSMACT